MFNLIPVVMLLLMQGAGGTDLSVRQQQALLDLAHRACAVQTQGELETALASSAGVKGADLAFWLQVFTSFGDASRSQPQALRAVEKEPAIVPAGDPGPTGDGWSRCVRSRDGPAAR